MNRPGMLLIFLLLAAAGLLLVIANPQPVEIDLYFARVTLQLGFALLLTLLLGLGAAASLGGAAMLRSRLRLARLQQRYDLVYEEVRTLRRLPIHEA